MTYAEYIDSQWVEKTPAQFRTERHASIAEADLEAWGLYRVETDPRPDVPLGTVAELGGITGRDGRPVREWITRPATAEEVAAHTSALEGAARAECRRRIVAVVDETTLLNLAANSAGGRLTEEQSAAYMAGLVWIDQMRATWRMLVDTGGDLSDDAQWPAPPEGTADLVAAF